MCVNELSFRLWIQPGLFTQAISSQLSFLQACDEDVWKEIDLFKAGLRRMASSADPGPKDRRADETSSMTHQKADEAGGVIFLETGGKDGSSAAKHAFIEAVPVNKNAFLDAPLYFRQVIIGPIHHCPSKAHVERDQPRLCVGLCLCVCFGLSVCDIGSYKPHVSTVYPASILDNSLRSLRLATFTTV